MAKKLPRDTVPPVLETLEDLALVPICRCLRAPAMSKAEFAEFNRFLAAESAGERWMGAQGKGKTYRFALPYGSYPGYVFGGLTNAQTVATIRAGMRELSTLSGCKFVETSKTSQAHLRWYVKPGIPALAQYQDGKIYINSARKVNLAIARMVTLHEPLHFLGYRSAPSGDKWYHCVDNTCVFNVNGGGTIICNHIRSWLRWKFGN